MFYLFLSLFCYLIVVLTGVLIYKIAAWINRF